MDKKKMKRKILAISASILILTTYYNIDHVYHPSYEIMDENPCGPFGCYSCGYIYIGDKEYLSSLTNLTENDILVEDQRFSSDPNMKIYSSYRIDDKDLRNEILEVLCQYEECYPSPWDRTIESMRLEWLMHNISYFFNHEQNRTGDVDLNNEEQEYYDVPVLNKILKL
ncbi:MAG: hypothetical protein II625_10605 [Bacilli bacterium]|nr:hypothetical protein [Bacilli bacterium]